VTGWPPRWTPPCPALDPMAGSDAQRVNLAAWAAAELVPARVPGAGPAGGHPDASGVLNRPYQLSHKVAEVFTAFARVGVTPLPAYCFPRSTRSVHRSRQNRRAGHARDAT
jgi:hypothetical protein